MQGRAVLVGLVGWLSLASQVVATGALARDLQQPPSAKSLAGSYLAGRFAKTNQSIEAAASFYGSALLHDPGNEVLIEQAFNAEISAGHFENAKRLAEKLVVRNQKHRLGQLFLGLTAFRAGDTDGADSHFISAGNGPIGELTSTLARAWLHYSKGEIADALALLDKPALPDWAQYYLRYHRGLISDASKQPWIARVSFERAFWQSRSLRVSIARARSLAHSGEAALALKALQGYSHPLAVELRTQIETGNSVSLLVTEPAQGLAEVLYGLGEALSTEGGTDIGIVYLQMSLYVAPDQPLVLAALAEAFEKAKSYGAAIATFDRVPKGSSLQDLIDIRKALDLNQMDKTNAAKTLLEQVAERTPDDLAPLDALGNILRARERYEEAITYYTRAIEKLGEPEKGHWSYYYSRGTCYERTKQWPKAEADFKVALMLSPEEPLILNYLGFSWVDQGQNLEKGLELIKKAVSVKPDDGLMIDSLGWAYHKLGRYADAVTHLERAATLLPHDSGVADHLGDALWKIGETNRAVHSWKWALHLGPGPAAAITIQEKLAKNLKP